MDTTYFARKGEIILDENGFPAFQLLVDVAQHDPMRADQVLDLRTGQHPKRYSIVPDFVRDWVTARLGFKEPVFSQTK